jgi:two-component system phosphate regulon sensor histidine kinase PhoR
MKKTLFARMLFGYAIVIAVFSVIIIFLSSNTIRDHFMNSSEISLREYAVMLKGAVDPYLNKGDRAGIEKVITGMKSSTDVRFTIIDKFGKVIADSDRDPQTMDNHVNRPEVRAAIEGKEGKAVRYSNTLNQDMLYLAVPVMPDGGGVSTVIRASLPLKDVKILIDKFYRDTLKALLGALIAAFVTAYFFSKHLYNPIKELAEASKKVANREFETRVVIKDRDDMRELAENFNFMTSQIKELFDEVSEKQKQLDAIINSVAEGLLVTDEKGKIILINKSFSNISGTECSAGNYYWECFMPVKFNELVEAGIKDKKYFVEQVEIKDRTYLCNVNFLEEKKQAAFVLYDITEFKDLERIKKDFVANVSHELRTPLTAIKGFAETLEQDTKDPESRHYLEIIKKNTERLINIVADLMTLSQLEEMEKLLESEKVDLMSLIANGIKISEHLIKTKGLSVEVDAANDLPLIKGDVFRLEQVFINLIDNAAKYTEKGSITIKAVKEDSNVKVTVADTGIGIPEEQIPRIFERFYVVDKSRSRKLGGTGLGLSIVKHIVILHGGKISVESRPDSGTTFTVILPIA